MSRKKCLYQKFKNWFETAYEGYPYKVKLEGEFNYIFLEKEWLEEHGKLDIGQNVYYEKGEDEPYDENIRQLCEEEGIGTKLVWFSKLSIIN